MGGLAARGSRGAGPGARAAAAVVAGEEGREEASMDREEYVLREEGKVDLVGGFLDRERSQGRWRQWAGGGEEDP